MIMINAELTQPHIYLHLFEVSSLKRVKYVHLSEINVVVSL
jgi:hypothetical protein